MKGGRNIRKFPYVRAVFVRYGECDAYLRQIRICTRPGGIDEFYAFIQPLKRTFAPADAVVNGRRTIGGQVEFMQSGIHKRLRSLR